MIASTFRRIVTSWFASPESGASREIALVHAIEVGITELAMRRERFQR